MMEGDLVFGEYSKEQWKGVALAAKPDITDEEYDEMWDGFIQLKDNIKRVEKN